MAHQVRALICYAALFTLLRAVLRPLCQYKAAATTITTIITAIYHYYRGSLPLVSRANHHGLSSWLGQ